MTYDIIGQLVADFRQLISDMTAGHVESLPLLDDFYDGVTITDSTGKICYINKVQFKIDDFDKPSVVGRYVYEVYRVDEGIKPNDAMPEKRRANAFIRPVFIAPISAGWSTP